MNSKVLNILLVDDEEDHVELIRRSLESAAVESKLSIASSLAEAKTFLADNTPDFILVDFRLSDGEGIELLPGSVEKRTMPIVVITGHGDEKVAAAAIKSGALDYIVKSDETLADVPHIVERSLREWEHITERKQAEDALKKSEEFLSTLTNALADAIFTVKMPERQIKYVNQTASQMFGYTLEEMVDQSTRKFYPDEAGYLAFGQELQTALTEGEPILHTGHELLRKNGDQFWADIATSFIYSGGKLSQVISMVRDVTERKQAESELQFSLSLLQSTIESTADGILVVNRDGKIERFNRQFAKLWNIPEDVLATGEDEQALAWALNQLVDPQAFLAKVHDLYAHPEEKSLDSLAFKDGRVFERYSQPQRVGDLTVGRVWSFRDVTERRKAEDALKQKLNEIERMNRLMVGRELKMEELRKEIKRLKDEAAKR